MVDRAFGTRENGEATDFDPYAPGRFDSVRDFLQRRIFGNGLDPSRSGVGLEDFGGITFITIDAGFAAPEEEIARRALSDPDMPTMIVVQSDGDAILAVEGEDGSYHNYRVMDTDHPLFELISSENTRVLYEYTLVRCVPCPNCRSHFVPAGVSIDAMMERLTAFRNEIDLNEVGFDRMS